MKMLSRLPESAQGLMPELAGILPMSKQTKAFLNVPKAVQEHRSEVSEKRASADTDRRPERLRASKQLARFADRTSVGKPDHRVPDQKRDHRVPDQKRDHRVPDHRTGVSKVGPHHAAKLLAVKAHNKKNGALMA